MLLPQNVNKILPNFCVFKTGKVIGWRYNVNTYKRKYIYIEKYNREIYFDTKHI